MRFIIEAFGRVVATQSVLSVADTHEEAEKIARTYKRNGYSVVIIKRIEQPVDEVTV